MTLVLERDVRSAQPGAQVTQRQPLEWHVSPSLYHSPNGQESDEHAESPPVTIYPTDAWTLPQLLSCYFAARKNNIPIRMSAIDPMTGREDPDESRVDTTNVVILERRDGANMANFFHDVALSLPEEVISPLPPIDNTAWTTDQDSVQTNDDSLNELEADSAIGDIPAPLQFGVNGHTAHVESDSEGQYLVSPDSEKDPDENNVYPHGLTLTATHLYTGNTKEHVVSGDAPSGFVRFPWNNKGHDGSAFSFRHDPEEGGVVRILDYDGNEIDTFRPGENAELVIGYGRDAIHLNGCYPSVSGPQDQKTETLPHEKPFREPIKTSPLPESMALPYNPWHIPRKTGTFSNTAQPDTDLMFDPTLVQKPTVPKVWEAPQSPAERAEAAVMRIVSPIAYLGERIRNGAMVVLRAPGDSVRDFIAIQKRAAAIKARMKNPDPLKGRADSVDQPLDDQQGLPEEAGTIDQGSGNLSPFSALGSQIGSIAHDIIFALPQSIHDFRQIQQRVRERREFWEKFDRESQKTDPGVH